MLTDKGHKLEFVCKNGHNSGWCIVGNSLPGFKTDNTVTVMQCIECKGEPTETLVWIRKLDAD